VFSISLGVALGQSKLANPAADWPMYTHDLAGTRFSPLKQIDKNNVARLAMAWSAKMAADVGPVAEITPVVIDGTMYLPAGNRILALDAETGKELWHFDTEGQAPERGVAYWPGDKNNPPRILFTDGGSPMSNQSAASRGTTPVPKLTALNAKTGKIDPGFGKEGAVEIGVGYAGIPTIFKNIVLLGAAVTEKPVGLPGDSRAYDARTGAKLWEFHSVPRPGEVGHETWLDEGWKGRSGVNVWGFSMTIDEERGLLYMPFGGPSANYYGGDRKGSNLFANSLVAVDAATGKYKWHFQTVHHDLWDSDLPPAPGLIDITQNGKKVPALALVGKTGWMFILDRVTGKPVFGVEERPVPTGDVPGEWYSPTQPFPVKPPALARTSFKREDMVTAEDTTAEHAKACQEVYERNGGFYNAGPFTPFLYHEEGAAPKTTIQFPGMTGGANWGGTATDPTTGYVFVQTHDASLIGWMEKIRPGAFYGRGTEGSTQLYDRGSVAGPGPYGTFSAAVKDENGRTIGNWPCQKPPWGRLSAVNANTGEIAWQVPLGLNEGLPEGKQKTGGSTSAGPLATAGGLVFIGATTDRRFRAFDSKSGVELWTAKLEHNVGANPMTYQGKNGKQYVAVMATDSLLVFALP
jgi:quinoprotein glucose dehydrogenase